MAIEPTEDIAKAVCLDEFDPLTGTVSASLFKDKGCSVSRLAICSREDTWELFRQRVENPPLRSLQRIGVINVGKLQEIGSAYESNPTSLTVEAVLLEGYLSHAEIPQKITRGLSNEIVRNLLIYREAR